MSPSPSNADDIRAWAYSDDAEPQQDFDLLITGLGNERLFLDLATDNACPKRKYFLSCLYLFVGDAVSTRYETNSRTDVEELLGLADAVADEALREWIGRSRQLIVDPESFDYDLWCGGGYASDAR